MPCTPEHLIKRDGSIKDFDPSKIQKAIEKAGKATGEFGPAIAAEITENQVMPRSVLTSCPLTKAPLPSK